MLISAERDRICLRVLRLMTKAVPDKLLARRRTFGLGFRRPFSATRRVTEIFSRDERRTLCDDPTLHKGILTMNVQRAFLCSITRPAPQCFLALSLVVAIAASLTPFASPAAWADDADDFRIWGNVTARGNFGFIEPDLKRW